MAKVTTTDLLLETMALAADENASSRRARGEPKARNHGRCEFERTLLHVAHEGDADGHVQRMARRTRLGLEQRTLVPFSLPDFNRLVRIRMLGGAGRTAPHWLVRLQCSCATNIKPRLS